MATFPIIRKGLFSSFASVFHTNLMRFAVSLPIGIPHHKSTDIDALDIFTTDILLPLKKSRVPKLIDAPPISVQGSDRSDLLKKVSSERQTVSDMQTWNQNEIDHYLMVCMDCDDRTTLLRIIGKMLELKRLPSDAIILRVFCHLCDDDADSMATISRLIDLCSETNMEFYAKNVKFAPFLSQYLWKLKRYDDALSTLNSIYATTNKSAKSLILRNYRQIIFDAIRNGDESLVERIVSNAECVNGKHKDPILIIYVWSDCFFSELFRNQTKATVLFTRYDAVRQAVAKKIGTIALTLLQQHNIDGMHRLIEACLASKQQHEVNVCLVALFDYHCKSNLAFSFSSFWVDPFVYAALFIFRLAT